jgi:hypothetical protein
MPLLIKAHFCDGSVMHCDEKCHESLDYGRPCICFGRFHGVGYEAAREALPEGIHHIIQNCLVTLPDLRSLELHFQICKSLKKPARSWVSTLRAILARTLSTLPRDTARSGSSSHRP